MKAAAAGLRLAVFSVAGLLAGLWVALAPWVIGFPQPPRGWSAADISAAIAGGVVIAVSGAWLVASTTSALRELETIRPGDRG